MPGYLWETSDHQGQRIPQTLGRSRTLVTRGLDRAKNPKIMEGNVVGPRLFHPVTEENKEP
jgi:hypothetical protein